MAEPSRLSSPGDDLLNRDCLSDGPVGDELTAARSGLGATDDRFVRTQRATEQLLTSIDQCIERRHQ